MAEVETSRDGGVLTITLNRPGVLNAFTAEMHKQLVGGGGGGVVPPALSSYAPIS